MNKEYKLFRKNKQYYESKNFKLVGIYKSTSKPYEMSIYHSVYTITDPETKIQYIYEDLEESQKILQRNLGHIRSF